jgi:staphylococcal nuclease domain-containing protein 1
LAEALINKGLAGVIRHRQNDEDRSKFYDQLMIAEDKQVFIHDLSYSEFIIFFVRAQKAKKGMFSDKEPPITRLVDASETAAKARSFLPSFKRGGKLQAVVEYVAGPSRFRMFIPKDQCKFSVS